MPNDPFNTLRSFRTASGSEGRYYSLPELEKTGLGKVSRLPISLRIVLEAVLRNCDGTRVTEQHVRELAAWQAQGERTSELPFVVARVILQDFRSEEHTSELQSRPHLVCRLLLEKKKTKTSHA